MTSDAQPLSSEIQRYLATYDSPIREIATALRQIILEVVPNAIEVAYEGYNAIIVGFRHSRPPQSGFCYLLLETSRVTLGFSRGADLPDPDRLLKGTARHARYLGFRSVTEVEEPKVRMFLALAVDESSRRSSTRGWVGSTKEPSFPRSIPSLHGQQISLAALGRLRLRRARAIRRNVAAILGSGGWVLLTYAAILGRRYQVAGWVLMVTLGLYALVFWWF